MEPISPIDATPLIIEGGQRWQPQEQDTRQALPPYWRELTQNLLATGSDEARFALLKELAAGTRAIPGAPDIDAQPISLKIRDNELAEWAAGQSPTVRGRMLRLLHGARIETPWEYHALQGQGRFSVRWKRLMCGAAQRYVAALAADTSAMAALMQTAGTLDANARTGLLEAMTRHACDAWEIRMPAIHFNAREDEGAVQRAAETTFKQDGRIEYFPWALAQGPIELVAVVFHESTHLVQMYRLQEERALLGAEAQEAIDDYHADILRLSFDYAGMIGARQFGNYYYLYRFETEVEREAHLAGLEAALIASGRAEFNPRQNGTMAAVRARTDAARTTLEGYDPNLVAQEYVEKETGLRIDCLRNMAERAGDDFVQRASTLSALMKRSAARPTGLCAMALSIGAGVSLAVLASLRRQRSGTMPAAPVEKGGSWIWQALHKLQKLRDGLDRSGMLAQAILSSAPKALYGVSEESRFLRAAFSNALNPDGAALRQFVHHHLEQHFALATPSSAEHMLAVLHAVRMRYRTPLAREILQEAACEIMAANDRLRHRLKKAAGI